MNINQKSNWYLYHTIHDFSPRRKENTPTQRLIVKMKHTIDEEKESACFIGYSSSNECFTSTRRSIQQDTSWGLQSEIFRLIVAR